jgi:ectoine hydroxylase-related dioxygenase (phytanoyl-CoA dioxygenase family)
VELRVAAEAGIERRGERGGAAAVAVEDPEALEAALVSKTRRASRRRENWPVGSCSSRGRAGGVVAVRATSRGRNTAHHSSWSGDSSTSFVHACGESPGVQRFLFSELMAQIARTALGDTVYLFNEQYVVKAAERGMRFGWHQDSGFIDYPHAPYLTCWIALDDVGEANGTVYLLPYDRAGVRDVVAHTRDAESNDMIGYFGDDPGNPVVVTAGSIACFSSTVFHRSGTNTTDHVRRVYVAQYSAEPVLSQDGSRPRHLAEPLLVDGERVRRPEARP